jgi:nicotinamidase-related amidase
MDIDPTTTAVIAVHLEQDIVGAGGALSDFFHEQVEARQVLAVAARFLDAARAAAIPVIYTRVAFAQDYSNMQANSPLLAGTRDSGALRDGTPGAEIVPQVAPGPDDIVVTHQRVGGFVGSSLGAELETRGISTLVIFGVATIASVESTARQASDLGFRVILAEDACSATTLEAHQASIAALGFLAEISNTTELADAFAIAAQG